MVASIKNKKWTKHREIRYPGPTKEVPSGDKIPIQVSLVWDNYEPDGTSCGWGMTYYQAYIVAIEEIDNNRDDLLPYWYCNLTKLFTGCTVFDKNYVHKEWSKKRDWYGIAMFGPESSK